MLAACSPALPAGTSTPAQEPPLAASRTPTHAPPPTPSNPGEGVRVNRRVDDFQAAVPPQLVPKDGILPIYEPNFEPAAEAPLLDEELVIGVALDGEAKAYPISVLRFREMVNDELAGIPTLVTW